MLYGAVKLTVLAGGLSIGEAAVTTDDITLGTGNLTLNVVGNVTQVSGNVITAKIGRASCRERVKIKESGKNVRTQAANNNGPISYTDTNTLFVGTVIAYDSIW